MMYVMAAEQALSVSLLTRILHICLICLLMWAGLNVDAIFSSTVSFLWSLFAPLPDPDMGVHKIISFMQLFGGKQSSERMTVTIKQIKEERESK